MLMCKGVSAVDKPLVSIIIPTYNMEKYLEECLDSVVNQTYKNLEIIAVNAGSTDKSLDIMETYAQKDKRIKIVPYFKNGLAATRNAGLAVATGEYIMFLDSDDYFDCSLAERLVDEAETYQCDMVIFNGKSFEDYGDSVKFENKRYFSLDKSNEGKTYTGFEILKITGGRINQACMKIYRNSFILDNKLVFIEKILGEDTPYLYKALINTDKVRYVDIIGYYRRYRPGSIMTENPLANTTDRIKTFDTLLSLRDSKVVTEENKKILNKQFAYYACAIWAMAINRKDEIERKTALEIYKTHGLSEFLKNNRVDFLVFVFSIFVLLPDMFMAVKLLFGKFAKLVLKKKSRFFKDSQL